MNLDGVKNFFNRPLPGELPREVRPAVETRIGRAGRWIASLGTALAAGTVVVQLTEYAVFQESLRPEIAVAYISEAALTAAGVTAWIHGRREGSEVIYDPPMPEELIPTEEAV